MGFIADRHPTAAEHEVDLRRDWRRLVFERDKTSAVWHHVEAAEVTLAMRTDGVARRG